MFNRFNSHLEAAKIQGFKWGQDDVVFNETTYLILLQRYKEIPRGGGDGPDKAPYDLTGYIIEIDTEVIDSDYMNSRFDKYYKLLHKEGVSEEVVEQALNELHKSFATLSQEEQKYANIFLHDIQRGDVFVEEGKTLRDYTTEYQCRAKNDQIHSFAVMLGLDESMLRSMMSLRLTDANINEFDRLDKLKKTVDKAKAKQYFEKTEGISLNLPKVNIRTDKLLRDFIISGGFEMEQN